MRLFFKHHYMYIFGLIFMGSSMMGIYWLDGYQKLSTLFYGMALLLFCLIAFIVVSYFSKINLYRSFKQKETIQTFQKIVQDSSPLSKEVHALLDQQYRAYYHELTTLKNAQKEHNQFIHLWVHQMKSPVAVIELMAQDSWIDTESLIEESDRLKEGLNLALNMARLESFEEDFVIETLSLKEAVSSVVLEHKRNFIRNSVYPKVEISEELFIQTDKKWLSFILFQILSNAIKYSKGTNETIKIYADNTKQGIKLSIVDKGIGIESGDLPRVFRPFFTGENGRNYREATGMGLYLANEITASLGHKIEIESEIGKGTKVSIYF